MIILMCGDVCTGVAPTVFIFLIYKVWNLDKHIPRGLHAYKIAFITLDWNEHPRPPNSKSSSSAASSINFITNSSPSFIQVWRVDGLL